MKAVKIFVMPYLDWILVSKNENEMQLEQKNIENGWNLKAIFNLIFRTTRTFDVLNFNFNFYSIWNIDVWKTTLQLSKYFWRNNETEKSTWFQKNILFLCNKNYLWFECVTNDNVQNNLTSFFNEFCFTLSIIDSDRLRQFDP